MSWSRVGLIVGALVVGSLLVVGMGVARTGNTAIASGVMVGFVPVGGFTRDQAKQEIERQWAMLQQQNFVIDGEGIHEIIRLDSLGAQLNVTATVDAAMQVLSGRSWIERWIGQRDGEVGLVQRIPAVVEFSADSIEAEVNAIGERYDQSRLDVRFVVMGDEITVRTDTQTGRLVNRRYLTDQITQRLRALDTHNIISVAFMSDFPSAHPDSAPAALQQAKAMTANPITFTNGHDEYSLTHAQLLSFIVSGYSEGALVPEVNKESLAMAVAAIAQNVNTDVHTTELKIAGNKVIDFVPPSSGKKLEEEKTIAMITDVLNTRRNGDSLEAVTLALPVTITHPAPEASTASLGITQLIGRATTTFVGSPANRKVNIKNGVRFLQGVIIATGEEFSTIKTLGTIDNTTGYLPELVIKENRTTPEYGGGLCQVSTTLFRAVMNAGLPITARQNHSYRVPYYERDGNGRTIGPGLDATIYDPSPDFRFRNDTGSSIVIQGFTKGDTITFELYGTSDGRSSTIDGPRTLSTIPPGPDIIVETDTLKPGEKKKLDSAHPGGTAIATYTITYSDGRVDAKEFKSIYKRWPARYLVGVAPKPVDSPEPSSPASPDSTPTADSPIPTEDNRTPF